MEYGESSVSMFHILAKRHIHRLAEFASSNVLVAFDYDGTLAPIVSDPAVARMRPGTRRLLIAVARRYPCVVISGRARQDVVRRVGGIPVWHVSGNHGLEPWSEQEAYATRVRAWVRNLKASLLRLRRCRDRGQDVFGDGPLPQRTPETTGCYGDRQGCAAVA